MITTCHDHKRFGTAKGQRKDEKGTVIILDLWDVVWKGFWHGIWVGAFGPFSAGGMGVRNAMDFAEGYGFCRGIWILPRDMDFARPCCLDPARLLVEIAAPVAAFRVGVARRCHGPYVSCRDRCLMCTV